MTPLSSATLRHLLAEHEAQRPDHLKALHPEAPRALRDLFTDWCDRKRHLETQLVMALAAEENTWTPAPWPGQSDVHRLQERKTA